MEANILERLNYKECLLPNDQKAKIVARMIWYMMAEQPVVNIHRQISYWGKRLYCALFQTNNVPLPLEFEQAEKGIYSVFEFGNDNKNKLLRMSDPELDNDWKQTENDFDLQLASNPQEMMDF